METIDRILSDLDERTIARAVGVPHDEARLSFRLEHNTVADYRAFEAIIGEYTAHHFAACVARGGRLETTEALGRAKELLEAAYRRQGGDMVSAFNDSHEGTNGGLRAVLDLIADGLKTEAVQRHIRGVFDRYVEPTSWEAKVELMRGFLARVGPVLGPTIHLDQPERYARDYRELIRAYTEALQRTSSIFRRL